MPVRNLLIGRTCQTGASLSPRESLNQAQFGIPQFWSAATRRRFCFRPEVSITPSRLVAAFISGPEVSITPSRLVAAFISGPEVSITPSTRRSFSSKLKT